MTGGKNVIAFLSLLWLTPRWSAAIESLFLAAAFAAELWIWTFSAASFSAEASMEGAL